MRRTLLVLVAVSVAALFASCKSTDVMYSYAENTVKTLELDGTGITRPIAADINVKSSRITWSETFDNDLKSYDVSNPKNSGKINYMKDYTLAKALKENNSDLLVAPIYSISTSGDLRKITVNVTGYPATYTNFRNATESDFEFVRKMNESQTTVSGAAEAVIGKIGLPLGK